VAALTTWPVDLYYDLHVTDDTDHQYDMTYGHNWPTAWSPAIAAWLENTLLAATDADLREQGHIPGRHVQLIDHEDPAKGLLPGSAVPASNGWETPATSRPSVRRIRSSPSACFANYVLPGTLRLGEAMGRRAVRETQDRRTELSSTGRRGAPPYRRSPAWSGTDPRSADPSRHRHPEDVDAPGSMRASSWPRRRPAPTGSPAWSDDRAAQARPARRTTDGSHARRSDDIGEPRLAQPFEGRGGTARRGGTPVRDLAPGRCECRRISLSATCSCCSSPRLDSYFAWLLPLGPHDRVMSPVMELMANACWPRTWLAEPSEMAARETRRRRSAAPKSVMQDPNPQLQWLYERTPYLTSARCLPDWARYPFTIHEAGLS
jgi:hypothetical protein